MNTDVSQYTPMQVLAALKAQGYDNTTARKMMATMGPMAIPEAQGSNIIPNLSEGLGLAGATHLVAKHAMPGPAKFLLPMVAGNIGNIAGAELSGTNYYDQASTGQILGDIGGSIAGGMVGSKFAEGYAGAKTKKLDDVIKRRIDLATKQAGSKKQADIIKQQIEDAIKRNNVTKSWSPVSKAVAQKGVTNAVAKRVVGKIAGRAAGMGVGRLAGGALGSLAGPVGTIVGSTVGGYLVPKLFANEEEKAVDKNAGMNGSTAALLAGGTVLASPFGAGTRKMISNANDAHKFNIGNKSLRVSDMPGHYANEYASKPMGYMQEQANKINQSELGMQAKQARAALATDYNTGLNKGLKEVDDGIAARQPLDNTLWSKPKNAWHWTTDNFGRTQAIGDGVESMSKGLGERAARYF